VPLVIFLAAIAVVSPWRAVRAQLPIMLQGIVDFEGWSTSTDSPSLTRNRGRAAVLGRLTMWSAVEFAPGVSAFAQIEGGMGDALNEATEVELYMAGIRVAAAPWFVVDAGRIANPVGAFAPRRFSNRNPLIGTPNGYPVLYPEGLQFSGKASRFDWRLAIVNAPIARDNYSPPAAHSWRPAVSAGVTLATGVRIGASATVGSYLSDTLAPALLAGKSSSSYRQRVVALDAQFNREYVELRGEWARSAYDVPGASTARGNTWYGEAKITVAPRWFLAGRVEHNAYPYIEPYSTFWGIESPVDDNLELGIGFRVSPDLLLKGSWRGGRSQYLLGDIAIDTLGHAFAIQVSQSFDVLDWITPE
jgi:hypothetical protein